MDILNQTDVFSAIVGAIVGGLIGILGSIATIIANSIISNFGGLSIFSNYSEVSFQSRDSFNAYVKTSNSKEAQRIEIHIAVNIYNKSGVPKTLGNFRVELVQKQRRLLFPTNIYKITNSGLPFSINVPAQTIFPKQSIEINCMTFIGQNEIQKLGSNTNVFLLADFPNNRKFRCNVLKFDMQ